MAFGREVHDRVGPVLGQQPRDQFAVADVAVHEHVVGSPASDASVSRLPA
jgi:hypothetical protein